MTIVEAIIYGVIGGGVFLAVVLIFAQNRKASQVQAEARRRAQRQAWFAENTDLAGTMGYQSAELRERVAEVGDAVADAVERALLRRAWMLYSDSKLLNAVWLAIWRLAVDTSIDGDDDDRPAPF